MDADKRTGDLLLRLASLTKLDLSYDEGTAQVDFLSQLPLLSALSLDCYKYRVGGWHVAPDAVWAALMRCVGITDLNLKCGLNAAQLSALFAKLRIKKLTLWRADLRTLECFAEGPITESLEELTLDPQDFSPSEVLHLYNLRRLRSLHLDDCCSPRLSDATVDSLAPPSSVLPALTRLFHRGQLANGRSDYRERDGPSFEWMQARLSQ